MSLRRILCTHRRWVLLQPPSKYYLFRPKFCDHLCFHSLPPKTTAKEVASQRCSESLKSSQLHAYSSESDASRNKQNKSQEDVKHCNAHERRESPCFDRRDEFKIEILTRIVPWEKINVSWDTFPYPIDEHTKSLLVEFADSHLRYNKFASSFGTGLASSSGRILLQSIPGTERYQERLVRALAQHLQVPLLVFDRSILTAYDIEEPDVSEDESEDAEASAKAVLEKIKAAVQKLVPYNVEELPKDISGKEGSLESDSENEERWSSDSDVESDATENEDAVASAEAVVEKIKAAVQKLVPYNVEESSEDISGEEGSLESENEEGWSTYSDAESHASENEDAEASAEAVVEKIKAAVQKLVPYNVEELPKIISGESETSKSNDGKFDDKFECQLRKGDRVKYIGPDIPVTADDRPLANGQRGEVYEVNGDRVSVILDINEDELESVDNRKPPICWTNVNNIEHDLDAPSEDCYIAMEALCEVLHSEQPLIVYFPDGLHKSVPKSIQSEFFHKVQEKFELLSGPIVLICGQNKAQSKGQLLFSMNKGQKTSKDGEFYKPFNVLSIQPPKDEKLLAIFKKQLEEDRKIVISQRYLKKLRKVLDENQLSSVDLLHVDTDGVILTKQNQDKSR
ncbi:uncharacterized protein LOC130745336 isoform X2 [Lotus japonicus]|uniref:uncharacterized protein LOC130745336 isoform X2 n=1 Tax=Lotus japonicus TaxID=34305 RepID=UPI002584B521|nr:uncharacterized protein LOC130745336 isoform X2 [Lotus japonicus]